LPTLHLVKSGNEWQICQELGRSKGSYGLKIGIGIEWESKAIVALTMHGERHSNDAVSFREELMLSQRTGLVHITDKGPFSSETMVQIQKNCQYFIIKLKSKVKYKLVHQVFLGNFTFQLETASRTKIRLLEEKLIKLEVNPELNDLKYIRFQYNSLKTGQFKTIEVITSLPLSAEQIIRAHAWRWTATETEFRILQHQFGLEKLFIKKPHKAWPLLLLVLCGKMLMELTYRSIHLLHGGSKTAATAPASFRRGFKKFVDAVLLGIEDPFELIEPCDDAYCCFRNNHGQRRK